jgi:acyl-[acyl-carrier-protein]-phospholipid O-acyltransferase/long-chain-fatty-acid--[acyl-carrier-protein] ligase
LVVLHKLTEAKWTEFCAKLPQLDLPNLWKPRGAQFYHVDALPMLGTGKLDLRKIRELAVQFSNGETGR